MASQAAAKIFGGEFILKDHPQVHAQTFSPPHRPSKDADEEPEGRSVGDVVIDVVTRYEMALLILLLALVFAFAILQSHYKHFWFDEIFTILVANQPSWHKLAQAMPAEGNPPMNVLLTRLSLHLLGITNFSVRLPAMLGFLSALLGIYLFVRRECGAVFGLLAVAFTIAEPGWAYSYEARPYGVLLAFMMLVMVSWQSATRAADASPARPRRLALAGMGVGVVGAILSHHFGIVDIGVPLLFGEGVRLYSRRKLDWRLAACVIVPALVALAISLPMAHRTNVVIFPHFHPASSHSIRERLRFDWASLPKVIDIVLLKVLAAVALVSWCPWFLNKLRSRAVKRNLHDAPAHIFAAALGLTLLIPVTLVVMLAGPGWYFCRYGIGSIFGVSMLACLLFARQLGRRNAVVVLLLVFLPCSYLRFLLQRVRHGREGDRDKIVYADTSDLPIVIADPLAYPATWWYAPAAVKGRLVYLDATPQGQREGLVVVEAALVAEKGLFPAPLETYGQFVQTREHFLLYVGGANHVPIESSLQSGGFRLTVVRSEPEGTLYDVRRDP